MLTTPAKNTRQPVVYTPELPRVAFRIRSKRAASDVIVRKCSDVAMRISLTRLLDLREIGYLVLSAAGPKAALRFLAASLHNSTVFKGLVDELYSFRLCLVSLYAPCNLELSILNASKGEWSTAHLSPPQMKRGVSFEGAAIVARGSLIFAIGGRRKGDVGGVACHCFDTDSRSWRSMPSLTSRRSQHLAAYCDRGIYVVGGLSDYIASNGITNCIENLGAVERFDLSSWSWEVQPSMLIKSHDFAAVGLERYLYVLGGTVTKQSGRWPKISYVQHMQRFEYSARGHGSWKRLRGPTELRESCAAVVAKGRLWVFGGSFDDEFSRAVESYDPSSGLWTKHSGLRQCHNNLSAAVVGDRILLFGGGVRDGQGADERALEEQLPNISIELVHKQPDSLSCDKKSHAISLITAGMA